MKETWYIENPSQEQKILDLLRRNKWRYVPMNWLMRLWIANHTARICSLKKKGYQIFNKIEWVTVNWKKEKHSSYLLTWEPDEK